MDKEKKTYDMINIFRLICAYLIIIIHDGAFESVNAGLNGLFNNYICRIAVPFFFITSGYFLYNNYKEEGYIKKYIIKLSSIYIIATLAYSILIIPNMEQFNVLDLVKSIYTNGIQQSLWYFPALIMSVMFVYIFIRNQRLKSLGIISALLFILSLMGDSYFGLIKNTFGEEIVNAYNFVMSNTRNGLTFAVPFISLGVYINRYKLNEKVKHINLLFAVSSMILAVEAFYLVSNKVPKDTNVYFSLIIAAPLFFILALNSKVKISKETSRLIREMSLWIYTFHSLIILLTWKFNFAMDSTFENYLAVCGLSTILAYTISVIRLNKIKFKIKQGVKIIAFSMAVIILPVMMIYTKNKSDGEEETMFDAIEGKANTNVTGVLYKVSDNNNNYIYLQASFPIGTEKIYPLSKKVDNAIKDSNSVILFSQYINDEKFYDKIRYKSGDKLKNHITKEAFDVIKKTGTAAGYNENGVNYIRSGWVYDYIDFNHMNNYNSDSEYSSIDSAVAEYDKAEAEKLNKKISYIIEDDSKILLALINNDDDKVENAYALLTKYEILDSKNKNIDKSLKCWEEGDLDGAIDAYNNISQITNEKDKKIFAENTEIINKYKNEKMKPYTDKLLSRIEKDLKSKNTEFFEVPFIFYQCGLFRVDNSFIKDIENKGYKVEQIK